MVLKQGPVSFALKPHSRPNVFDMLSSYQGRYLVISEVSMLRKIFSGPCHKFLQIIFSFKV